ncbi:unnamed protein product [Arabidopsis halleri]
MHFNLAVILEKKLQKVIIVHCFKWVVTSTVTMKSVTVNRE